MQRVELCPARHHDQSLSLVAGVDTGAVVNDGDDEDVVDVELFVGDWHVVPLRGVKSVPGDIAAFPDADGADADGAVGAEGILNRDEEA